jgi:YidC/Oxa1 family membrane protein insertase
MSFLTIIETILLGPLKLLFEIIFQLANRFVDNPGLAIIFLSLIMNILVLPLYKRADAMQEAARDMDAKLHDGVAHIKKVFSGDEKMMILQTYYRQNHYKPTTALNGSVSLLLEIPFFMAAYQFLSHLELLNGATLGPISDLGAPDGLIVIGGIAINLLPIVMTLVNVISCALYLKGFPLKTKVQLYGMALFFLVFLYTSPAGLVFYWTLNNVFSLVKTIFYKLKNPRKVLCVLTSILGLAAIAFGAFMYDTDSLKRKVFLIGIGVLLELPMIISVMKSKVKISSMSKATEPNEKLFFLASLFLTLLVGVLIQSTFIAASPQEYVDITYFHNPLWYIASSASMAVGTFLVWMRVFYWLASEKGKVLFDKLAWVMCGLLFVNYMFFGTDLGIISASLQYENGLAFTRTEQLINLAILATIALVMYFVATKWSKVVTPVLLTAVIAFGAMSAMNIVKTKKSVDEVAVAQTSDTPNIQLSKTGKNVVVLMLDRAMGEYVPYIFNEKPELQEQFAGFTYYSNTISYGAQTNFGVPALVGGYEYTPVEMNKRSDESLVSKHNEALKVMPVLFAQNGYDVTVCDPPYANYQWIPDLTIYDEYPKIKTYNTIGAFSEPEQKEQAVQSNHRNFFCFSVMKVMPLCLQPTIYSNGNYNQTSSFGQVNYTVQTIQGTSVAEGINGGFMASYNVLSNMSNITNVAENEDNTFLFMCNDLTHQPMLLQEPEYVPAEHVDNTQYDAENIERFSLDGRTLDMSEQIQFTHYQTNTAALIQLGKWFDYLRENDIYNNTKIIIVSDHGFPLRHSDELNHEQKQDNYKNVETYFPLLLVKEFNSAEFSVSNEFMTNADVPTLATDGLIEKPLNPFTGKEINSNEKTAHDQFLVMSDDWDVNINNGNTFLPSRWAKIKNNLWDRSQWMFYEEQIVLDEHAFPESK